MKPHILQLLSQCIEVGVRCGHARAHKHTATPTEEQIVTAITDAIELELHQWFDFNDADRNGMFRRLLRAEAGMKNGDPLKDFMDDEDVEEALRLLAEIVRLSGEAR